MPDDPKVANTDPGSTPVADANVVASSTTPKTDAKSDESFEDSIAKMPAVEDKPQAAAPSTAEPKAPEPAKPAAGDVQQLNKTDEAKPQADVQSIPKSEYDHLPFHQHEDFRKLVKERNELREARDTVKPTVERLKAIDDFCTASGITGQQFKAALEIQALLNTNPQEAWKRLQPVVEQLTRFTGQGTIPLPDDLRAEVEAGTLSEARARQIVSLGEQKKFNETRATQTQMESRNNEVFNAITTWEQNIRTHDPDFPRKQRLVSNRFSILAADNAAKTGQQFLDATTARTLAQQAYDEINAEIGAFIPKPVPTKVLSTNGSAVAEPKEPKTYEEAMEQIYSKYASV